MIRQLGSASLDIIVYHTAERPNKREKRDNWVDRRRIESGNREEERERGRERGREREREREGNVREKCTPA